MAYVKVNDNENLERAIKRFKKKVEEEGIIKEYRERQYFQKPSVKKRERKKAALRKAQLKAVQDAKKFEKRR